MSQTHDTTDDGTIVHPETDYAVGSERALVATVLYNAQADPHPFKPYEWLDAEHFTDHDLRLAWKAIKRIVKANIIPDTANVPPAMVKLSRKENSRNPIELPEAELLIRSAIDDMASSFAGPEHARAIARAAQRRAQRLASVEMKQRLSRQPEHPEHAQQWLTQRLEEIKAWCPDTQMPKESPHRIFSLRELLARQISPAIWAIAEILAEGLTLLVGKAKMGKSWMVLNFALAIANGGMALGKIEVAPRDVLYLALEDNDRRLQDRAQQLMLSGGYERALDHFELATSWKRIDEGGLTDLENWVEAHPGGVVIIDTMAKIRPPSNAKSNIYQEDYAIYGAVKQISDKYRIPILAVTHFNKLKGGDDWFDQVSGSTGITGAVDNVLGLMRERGKFDAVLKGNGRDVIELEKALTFDPELCQWTIEGEASDYARSKERNLILDALRKNNHQAMTAKQVAIAINKSYDAARKTLQRMVEAREISAVSFGREMLYLLNEDVSHVSHMSQVSQVSQVSPQIASEVGRPVSGTLFTDVGHLENGSVPQAVPDVAYPDEVFGTNGTHGTHSEKHFPIVGHRHVPTGEAWRFDPDHHPGRVCPDCPDLGRKWHWDAGLFQWLCSTCGKPHAMLAKGA